MTLSAEMKSRLKRIWNVSTSIIVALAILLAVLLVGFRLFGFQIYTVLSGSMEPKYPVGSLVYVRKIEPEKLEVGDDISFLVSDKTVVTHRIVEILPDEEIVSDEVTEEITVTNTDRHNIEWHIWH